MPLLLAPGYVFAWGTQGHQLICAIAVANLTPQAHAFVEETLAMGKYLDGNEQQDLVKACTWADGAKYDAYTGSYESHYLNVPADKNSVALTRDCAALDCIVVAIQRNLTYLNQKPGSNRERGRKAAALRFVGHYIGDLHQPLHISNLEDWGGNKIRVTWFGNESNLHKLWDVELLAKAGLSYPSSLDYLSAEQFKLNEQNVLKWMDESFTLAREYAYLNADSNTIFSGDKLGQAYLERSKPVVILQLIRGGHRLAYLINALAAGTLDTNILIE